MNPPRFTAGASIYKPMMQVPYLTATGSLDRSNKEGVGVQTA